MKRIFKYVLVPTDYQIVKLPTGSRILSAESQMDDIVLYALIEDSQTYMDNVEIIVKGTGHDANDLKNFTFLNTVKLRDGLLMFHVFCDRLDV